MRHLRSGDGERLLAIAFYYRQFEPVGDDEVASILATSGAPRCAATKAAGMGAT